MKNKNYAFRISEKDLAEIKRKAKRANLSVTDFITQSALGKEIVVIEGLPEIISELKNVNRNLNQLSNISNIKMENLAEFSEQIANIYAEIRRALEVL